MTSMQTGMHYPIDLEALPVGWEKGYVGDFALEIQPGFASGKHNKEGRGIPHIRPYNIDRSGKLDLSEIKSVDPEADTKRLHSGDVLFNNTNSPELIGKTTVITATDDLGFSNHMTRVAFPDAISPKFAAYQLHYLWSRGYFLHNCAKHVNQASVSSTTLARTVPFVKPPRPQQDIIVAEIEKQCSRLDEAVANLKRVQANLKRYKAAILKTAVEGKLTEDWRKQHPNAEPASKLLERILVERRAKWKGKGKYQEPSSPDTSTLQKIPDGWRWSKLDQLLKEPLRNGHSAKASGNGQGLRAFTLSAVTEGDFSENNTKLTVAHSDKVTDLWAEPGDIYVERSNTPELVGLARLYKGPSKFAFIPDLLIRVRLIHLALPTFVEVCLLSEDCRRYFRSRAQGISGSMPKIDQSVIEQTAIPLPPLVEQKEIVTEVERRLSVIEELEATVKANLTRAERLKQSILGHAFSGRLIHQKRD